MPTSKEAHSSSSLSKVKVKLVIRLHHRNLKVVELVMELYHGKFEGGNANIETSLYGVPHPYKLVGG